jgi:hypothetical protein
VRPCFVFIQSVVLFVVSTLTAAAAVIKSDALLLDVNNAIAAIAANAANAAAAAAAADKTGSSMFFDWVTARIGRGLAPPVRGKDLQLKAFAMEAACACLAPIFAQVSAPSFSNSSTSATSTNTNNTANTTSNASASSSPVDNAPSAAQLASLVAPRVPTLVAACQAVLDDSHTPPELLPPLLRLISVLARKQEWLFQTPEAMSRGTVSQHGHAFQDLADVLLAVGAYPLLTIVHVFKASSQLFNVNTVASPSSTTPCPYHLLTIVHVFTPPLNCVKAS